MYSTISYKAPSRRLLPTKIIGWMQLHWKNSSSSFFLHLGPIPKLLLSTPIHIIDCRGFCKAPKRLLQSKLQLQGKFNEMEIQFITKKYTQIFNHLRDTLEKCRQKEWIVKQILKRKGQIKGINWMKSPFSWKLTTMQYSTF
jgi:hypothetical protein